jgi:putative DNA primase/helicase
MTKPIATPIYVERLIGEGLTEQVARDARVALLKTKKPISVSPDMPHAEREKLVNGAMIHNGPILRLAQLWQLIADAIAAGNEIVPGCRFEQGIKSKDGSLYNAIRLRWLEKPNEDWRVPTMILSATADPDLLKPIWPQLELVAEVNPEAPHAKVRQILFSASKFKLKNPKHIARLNRYIEVCSFEFRGLGAEIEGRRVDGLVVAQKKVREKLTALGLPDNVDTAHFNAVEGIDKWGGVAFHIDIGRTMPSPEAAELMAEVLTGKLADRQGAELENGWYPRNVAGIRVKGAGENGHPSLAEEHPDPTTEKVRRSVCEGGKVQTIGRPRAVNRKAINPVQIDIIGTQPLPFDVDEVLPETALEPNPLMLMAARGLVIAESATKGKWAIIQKVLSDRFPTEQAARHGLKRSNANSIYILANERLSSFVSASIKLEGSRYAVPVLIDGSRGDPRETAERLLGPLDDFKFSPLVLKETKP